MVHFCQKRVWRFGSSENDVDHGVIYSISHEICTWICSHVFCYGLILTHLSRMAHICDSELTIISSDNGLSPGQRQAIIWISAEILLIGPLGTNFSEIYTFSKIYTFPFKKKHLKMSSEKCWPFCPHVIIFIAFIWCICQYCSLTLGQSYDLCLLWDFCFAENL